MRTVELADALQPLSEYADSLEDEPIVFTTGKRPVAALVSLRDVDEESLALSTNADFLRIIRAARAEVAAGAVVSLEEMKREIR